MKNRHRVSQVVSKLICSRRLAVNYGCLRRHDIAANVAKLQEFPYLQGYACIRRNENTTSAPSFIKEVTSPFVRCSERHICTKAAAASPALRPSGRQSFGIMRPVPDVAKLTPAKKPLI